MSSSSLPRTRHRHFKGIIEIPIKGEDEVIEVSLDDLPEPEETLTILRDEDSPLHIWYQFALEYYRQGIHKGFETILQETIQRVLSVVHKKYPEQKEKERREFQRLAVQILSSQAAYYLNQVQIEKDLSKKNALLSKIIGHLNEADKVDPHEKNLWVIKGYNYMIRQEYEASVSHFNAVLQRTTDHPLATLGNALIAFKKKEYSSALTLFSRCIRSFPMAPLFVRYTIGICHMQLKNREKARRAFERVLQLNPKDVHAMVALAVLIMNDREEDAGAVLKSMILFKQAYELDPTHPIVLNYLAHHFIIKGDYDKAQLLATNAFHGNDQQPHARAESAYHLGRLAHIQGYYEQAMQHYMMATQLNPDFILARYGLGQMHLWKGNITEATHIFEKILQKVPDNYECIKLLGLLYRNNSSRSNGSKLGTTAIQYLKRATELNPHDIDTYLELAASYEGVDDVEASKSFDQAIALFQEQKTMFISAELLNNLGALKQRIQDYPAAKAAFEQALKHSMQQPQEHGYDSVKTKAVRITIMYNLARLYEEQCDYQKAEAIYQDIVKESPKYIDAYLRLGCICKAKGQLSNAYDWFKEGVIDGEERPEVWCLMGDIHMMKNEYKLAMKKFESNVKVESRSQSDPYSLISLANVYLQHSRHTQNRDLQAKAAKKAAELYSHALRSDPHNIYAAHGLGILLAEKGYHKEALEIFLAVRESATSDVADVSINIGHAQVELGQIHNAIKTYEACLKKFGGHRNVPLLVYTARAYYLVAKSDKKNTMMLDKAIHYLEHAVRIRPQEGAVWFNLGLCEQELAVIILYKERTDRSLEEVIHSQECIASSLK
jgi:RNA polymerase-associated protein CTR9